MNPEPEQAASKAEPKAPQKRTGVPVWRTGKPDAVLAAAVDAARTAIEGIAKASEIGEHLAARTEGDRLVTHLFESRLPGYVGWQWYAVLTRNSRSKVVTVNELGLLPSDDSILAPEWVPWAERVRPEDAQDDDAADEGAPQAGASEAGVSEAVAGTAEEAEASPAGPAEDSDGGQDDAPTSADAETSGRG
ncbi:MAG: hypothetical protein QOH40_2476 [Arthrobacter pascens]|nr:hypothetical protein [Arthrobacter pascens]